jgi:hypothetical protein
MPAKIRVRCKYLDCKFLDDLYCSVTDVEFDKKHGCLTYVAVEEVATEEEEPLEDDDLVEDEEEWVDEDDIEEDEAHEDEM